MSTIGTWAQQAPIIAMNAAIGPPEAVITDASGNLYFTTDSNPFNGKVEMLCG